jgi:hypothetical protein
MFRRPGVSGATAADRQRAVAARGEPRGFPACSTPAAPRFVRFGGLPAHGAAFATPEEARAVAVGAELTCAPPN